MPLREMDREQMWLLPPTLDELLPLDHPARFVAEFVDALDRAAWAKMGVGIEGDPLGAPAYHPRALLSVWLYGFMTNVRSCRKLEAACRDQIPYLWLTGWQHPDHNTLWRFYQGHRQGMRELFKRTVRTAVSLELVDLAMQAVWMVRRWAPTRRRDGPTPESSCTSCWLGWRNLLPTWRPRTKGAKTAIQFIFQRSCPTARRCGIG